MIDSTWRLYIDGDYVDATSDNAFDSINPATGEVLTTVQQAADADVDRAVASSRAAFESWSAMSGAQRGRILNNAARILRERNRELAELEVLDTGKPIQEAIEVDVLSAADAIEFYAGLAASLHGDHYDLGDSFAYTRREPLGVCVGIGAWNYPIQIAGWKSAPALACGNTMIYKPAELTPLTAAKLAEVYTEAGVPDGVFNVVQGDGRVGAMLTGHPDVAKVSLTGEVSTGKKVMQNAAGTLKQITLELGGKSPMIIFGDADLDNAASAALLGNFYTQGEVCSNGTRVFVQSEIYGEFLDRLRSRVGKIKVGDPMDPETHVGALITPEHMAKVLGYIEAGKAAGATLIAGGGRVGDPALAGGNFVEPTIFADAEDAMSIATDEIFGPVMTVLPFDGEDEVIARANRTHYGLAAGVFTRDVQRAHRVVAKLEAGTIWINNYNITPVEIPFGGYKQSGIGRENGLTTIDHYTQLKTVYVEGGDVEAPY